MDHKNPEDFRRWLFSQECTFAFGANSLSALPSSSFPEIAFVGRSNVGKSSLLNALLGRKSLARVSHTPGRTQQLNFFLLGKLLYIVDMPGYGYAAVSKEKIALFSELTHHYVTDSRSLKRVFVLIDSRHGLKSSDLVFMKMLDTAAVSYQLILTKIDKCSPTHLQELSLTLTTELKAHPAAFPSILSTSSSTKAGIPELQKAIVELLLSASPTR